MGGEEPSTLLLFCLYQVNIKLVECSLIRSNRTVAVCSSFVLLCTCSNIWIRNLESYESPGMKITKHPKGNREYNACNNMELGREHHGLVSRPKLKTS